MSLPIYLNRYNAMCPVTAILTAGPLTIFLSTLFNSPYEILFD